MGILKDSNGKISSKRVAGFLALINSLCLTYLGLFIPVNDALVYQWLGFASLALLGGLLEKKNV